MLLDFIAHDYSVQIFLILGLTAGYIVTIVKRGIMQEAEAVRLEQRLKDMRPISQQVANRQ